MRRIHCTLAGAGAALLIASAASSAVAEHDEHVHIRKQTEHIEMHEHEHPYPMADETWIAISGKVTDEQQQTFTLDYGPGTITVDVDGWQEYDQRPQSLEDSKVTVFGRIDDSLYETATIEADSVYVEELGTYFYAHPHPHAYHHPHDPASHDRHDHWLVDSDDKIKVGRTTIRGMVTRVDEDEEEFSLGHGPRELTVETDHMSDDPLDNEGPQRIRVGDYVSVTGEMDKDFWEDRELEADTVITLDEDD